MTTPEEFVANGSRFKHIESLNGQDYLYMKITAFPTDVIVPFNSHDWKGTCKLVLFKTSMMLHLLNLVTLKMTPFMSLLSFVNSARKKHDDMHSARNVIT